MRARKGILPNYIGGEWLESPLKHVLDVSNPATGEIITFVPFSIAKEVNSAVRAAKDAFHGWKNTPIPKRMEYLSNLRSLLIKHSEELARLITTEHGKVLSDARGEVQRTIENATKVLDISLTRGTMLANIAGGRIDEYSVRVPMGVFCIVTPFNFPAMIAFWSLPYAVACGNTCIVKPSEQTPITMVRIFELIHEEGFPPGVVNLLHGGKLVVELLLEHPDVVGVTSVGSTAVMNAIWKKATAYGKRAQCQGGAKNSVVVLPDVNSDKIIPHIIDSFYGNTGQRCLAGANLIVADHDDQRYKMLMQKILEAAQAIRVGNGLKEKVTMGPVISQVAKRNITIYIEKGVKEGAQLVLDGRFVKVDKYPNGYWLGPSILSDVTPEMTIAKEEIFGPVMPIIRAKNLDEAIRMINASNFGNAAMLFTSSGKAAQKFEYEVEGGNIGINIGLPAPVPPFSFAGMKDSFRGDLHGQGDDAVRFFTQEKVVIKRWL